MKKLLVLMLVLGLASLANATITYHYSLNSDGSGSTPDVLTGGTFYLVVSGEVSDLATGMLHVYDAYENMGVGSVDYADFTGTGTYGDNGNGNSAGGNLSAKVFAGATYDGWDFSADQTSNEDATDDAVDGIWFVYELTAGTTEKDGWFVTLYESDYTTPIGPASSINIVPEPITMALLGIGGLFLRRRRKA